MPYRETRSTTTRLRRRLHALLIAIALAAAAVTGTGTVAAVTPGQALPQEPAAVPAHPAVGPGTHVLDDASYLTGFNDPAWYESNIPFVDLPDKTIQDVYYYRWRVWKEHLRYTNPTDGWILTEFLDCCGYAAPYQAVDAAAGHHISEGRWLRDPQYLDDYTRFWLTGPGSGPKPATDDVNADTTDWAHQYSFWLASAAYDRAQVTGDFSSLVALLPQLKRQYHGWDKQFDARLGLYWSVPVWDAMEFSASSYESADPYHGGAGYRPTLNSYQYGDATAISRIAALSGDGETAREYAAKAAALKTAMHRWLWDPSRQFYLSMPRDDNPQHRLLDTREEIGYIPWQFGAAKPGDAPAWAQLLDPQGFAAPYGPTTAERRSPWFMHEAGGCCRWDGPSWPFSTAQTLTGMANLLDDHPEQRVVTRADYADALTAYARTQFKDGRPYVAEAHSPDQDAWIYDGGNHSEDYNHSTFNDLVLSGLLGLRPQNGASLRVQPLVPVSWDHYAVENVPYHGRNVTVLWDRDGSHYHQGAGMRVYVDGKLVRSSATLKDMTVPVEPFPSGHGAVTKEPTRLVNDAANPLRQGYPKPIASYTWRYDNAWSGLDGKVWFNEVPQNTRWTNYASPHGQDYYGVDFGVPTPVSDIRWYGYDDSGGVRPAVSYRLQYWTGDAWTDVPGQVRDRAEPAGNGLNRVTFPVLTTERVRLLFTNPSGAYVGVSELQSWAPSSRDAVVKVGPDGTGALPVNGRTTVEVTVANTTGRRLSDPVVSLAVPSGWTAAPAARRHTAKAIPPRASAVWRFTLTPPPGASGTDSALVATATYGTHGHGVAVTHTRRLLTVAFDPEAYTHPQVVDDFSTDSRADYSARRPYQDEAVPELAIGGGQMTARAGQRFFTLLDRGMSPTSPDAAVIVDPAAFIGDAPNEDSLFVGLVRDDTTYIGAWYNNHHRSTGIDVRVDGALNPSGSGACCTSVTLTPGDRLAFQTHGTTVSSWAEHDGTWQRLTTTDVGSAVDLSDPSVRSSYHFMFGVRGDPGTIAVDRFEARSGAS
ncbi:MGH1-like glycoside hydrolase domain-containing protein [Actinacidiphila soli]|uniref:MGH1-like glycoside hydrolase domain-containing protein n=1 Tax=Actinacidiphila soli TaxID=2487275 RepID=UPI0019D09A04|nr:glycosyl hydrolase family 65 protein [Actinacidiphila soli]